MSTDNIYVCAEHFIDNDLIRFARESEIHTCSICNNKTNAINSCDRTFQEVVRGLIRFYYPEYAYNQHVGGVSFHELFKSENPIFKLPSDASTNPDSLYGYMIDDAIDGLDSDHSIRLHAGFIGDMRELYTMPLRESGNKTWQEVKTMLTTNNYVDVIPNYQNEINNILNHAEITLKSEELFFRARIGFELQKEKKKFGNFVVEKKIPYKEGNIKAPPPNVTPSGRANRERISYYYLASTSGTSIAEVRPHPGHYVSVAKFSIVGDLRICDFTSFEIKDFVSSEIDFQKYVALRAFAEEFESPITPDAKNRYVFSQFLSDIIKNAGFDGIKFNSSIGKGVNYVIFDKNKVAYVKNSRFLYLIKKHSYECSRVTMKYDGFIERYEEQHGPTLRK